MHLENASVELVALERLPLDALDLEVRLEAVVELVPVGELEPQAAMSVAIASTATTASNLVSRNGCLTQLCMSVSLRRPGWVLTGQLAGTVRLAREQVGKRRVYLTVTDDRASSPHGAALPPALRAGHNGWRLPGEGAMRVLLVEDHQELAETVADVLRSEGMAVDVALDGQAALERVGVYAYDVVVLDRDLPLVHGDEVCRRLVADGSPSRVLMLTAAGRVEDRVDGLELGADDYLPKPFAFTELIARIRALCRRSGPPLPAILGCGDLRLDPARRTAIRAGRRLALSPKEFAVLEHLMVAGGRLVSAEELLERVWDEAADPFTATVKVTIARVRCKLGDPPLIETVREGGYRISEP
jgi:DNA-binding response OmpR family regulator